MMRLWHCCLYYFRWQRIMVWTCGLGLVLIALSLPMPGRAGAVALALGALFAIGFPLMFAGVAFRQLIGNVRLVMVPSLRVPAALALLVLALIGAAAMALIQQAILQVSLESFSLTVVQTALLSFTLLSAYLLLSQWLSTYPFGQIVFILLPLLMLREFVVADTAFGGLGGKLGPMLVLVSAGWIWLLVEMRRGRQPRPLATLRWERIGASDPDHRPVWTPQIGPGASARGTIMRGYRDGWQNRLTGISIALLGMPVVLVIVLWILGEPLNGSGDGALSAGFFLAWSLLGVVSQAPMTIREWPARLRLLWLRQAGDRNSAWAFLERELMRDAVLIASGSSAVALLFVVFTDVDRTMLALYVAGCITLTALSAYFGCWSRASGWPVVVHIMFVLIVAMLCFAALVLNQASGSPAQAYWLAAVLVPLTLVFRGLANRGLAGIDWCAVRPVRSARARRRRHLVGGPT